MTVVPFRIATNPSGFTAEDLRAFRRWDGGRNRVEIDDPSASEMLGQFAMIYEDDNCWASWAVAREGSAIVLWDCVSLQTLGRFQSVRAALAGVPGVPLQSEGTAEIIQLRPLLMQSACPAGLTLHR